MKYLLIAIIAGLSANAFAHTSNIICIKKHDKHVNICIQHKIHRYSTHHHYKPNMVTINNQRSYQISPTSIPGINTYVYKPSKIDKVLDTTIKIAIIKHLLED
jgi:hypothetical protein